MALPESSAPFPLGQTYYQNATIGTVGGSTQAPGIHLEGQLVTFNNAVIRTGSASLVTIKFDAPIVAECVRNVSGIALLPKRLAIYKSGSLHKRVDGYTSVTAQQAAGVVDPFLPAAGVPNNDLFWLIKEGEVECLTALSNYAADVGIGDWGYAITAASSQASAAGRLAFHNSAGTFSAVETTDGTLFKVLTNKIGQARSTKLTNNTNAGILMQVKFF